jgi:hypothetical protein
MQAASGGGQSVELALISWRKALLALVAVLTPLGLFLIQPRLGAAGLIAVALALVMAVAYRLL